MNILVSGGSGLVGSATIQLLLENGHTIYNLTTQKALRSEHAKVHHIYWNPRSGEVETSALPAIDAVVNLAGFSVANKWTKENKEKMISSRIESTRLLVKISGQAHTFVSASASGIYRDTDEWQDEQSAFANDFLAQLSITWEEEAQKARVNGARVALLRIGVVLDQREGALGKMIPFFKMGLGSAVGRGSQYMSWIHLHDLARMLVFAVENKTVEGAYNAVAPAPVTNKQISKSLAKALNRPFFLPNVPAFALRLAFGEMADMLFTSKRLKSEKIQQAGFTFQFPDVDSAMRDLFQK
ncbi:MAG: TIGR01777 family oxidoreductase [Flavobacteriales bacterium]